MGAPQCCVVRPVFESPLELPEQRGKPIARKPLTDPEPKHVLDARISEECKAPQQRIRSLLATPQLSGAPAPGAASEAAAAGQSRQAELAPFGTQSCQMANGRCNWDEGTSHVQKFMVHVPKFDTRSKQINQGKWSHQLSLACCPCVYHTPHENPRKSIAICTLASVVLSAAPP